MNPRIGPDDEDNDVVFIDETNSVVTGRQPAREFMRRAIRNRLEKDKKLLELKEKMYGKPDEGQNGHQGEGPVEENHEGPTEPA
jgi:hypothetical protein